MSKAVANGSRELAFPLHISEEKEVINQILHIFKESFHLSHIVILATLSSPPASKCVHGFRLIYSETYFPCPLIRSVKLMTLLNVYPVLFHNSFCEWRNAIFCKKEDTAIKPKITNNFVDFCSPHYSLFLFLWLLLRRSPILECCFTTDRFLPPFPLTSMINMPFRILCSKEFVFMIFPYVDQREARNESGTDESFTTNKLMHSKWEKIHSCSMDNENQLI